MKNKATITLDLFEGQSDPVIAARPPPTRFRLFRAGVNSTRKGQFLFDETAAQEVMARAAEWGVEYVLDYDHAMVHGSLFDCMDPAQRGKAAGWFKLAVENGELVATDVKWTPNAAAAITQGEWRYISPAFNYEDNGRIVEIINAAITNLPATDHPDPLRALSRQTDPDKAGEDSMLKTLLSMLGLAENANESEAIKKLLELLSLPGVVEKLNAKISGLEAERAKAESERLSAEIEVAVKDGRVPPAQREILLGLGKDRPEVVREFLASAPRRVQLEDAPVPPTEPVRQSGAAVVLTAVEKQACKLLGLSHKDFLESKKALAEKETV